jgi:hypothetical protein
MPTLSAASICRRRARTLSGMSQEGVPTPDPRTERPYADCVDLYGRSREVMIPRSDGTMQRYAPTRFMQQIERAHAADALMPAVASIVRNTTKGFGHLADAGREDLMLESLVVDESRPYHCLFSAATVAAARGRLEAYREQGAR